MDLQNHDGKDLPVRAAIMNECLALFCCFAVGLIAIALFPPDRPDDLKDVDVDRLSHYFWCDPWSPSR